MKSKQFILAAFALTLAVAGCSKTDQTASPSKSPTDTAPAAAAPLPKPKPPELTKAVLLDAFRRSSINSLPPYLKISDVQFKVVNSVDTTRVIEGNVTLEFLADTFRKTRVLQFQTPSTSYNIQLLKIVRKKGEQVSLPFSTRIDLASERPSVELPALDDYGMEASQLPHSFVEGSEQATKAESLINAALAAQARADHLENKWQNLVRLKEGITDEDAFRHFLDSGGWSTIIPSFDDVNYYNSLFDEVANKLNGNLAAQYKAFTNSVTPLLDKEYQRVAEIITDAKDKSKACDDYLLNL